jgi:hypothetical protein
MQAQFHLTLILGPIGVAEIEVVNHFSMYHYFLSINSFLF